MYVHLGGSVANLTACASLPSQKPARHYAKHPPKWKFSESVTLPFPKRFLGAPFADLEFVVVRTKDLWPTDAWKRQAGPVKPRARQIQGASGERAPHTASTNTSKDTPTSLESLESSTDEEDGAGDQDEPVRTPEPPAAKEATTDEQEMEMRGATAQWGKTVCKTPPMEQWRRKQSPRWRQWQRKQATAETNPPIPPPPRAEPRKPPGTQLKHGIPGRGRDGTQLPPPPPCTKGQAAQGGQEETVRNRTAGTRTFRGRKPIPPGQGSPGIGSVDTRCRVP